MVKNKDWFFPAICLVIILGIIYRFMFIGCGLWHDECAFAVNILDKNYFDLFKPMRLLQAAPPLFSCAVKFFITLNFFKNNFLVIDFLLRIIPFTGGILSLFAFKKLLEKLFKNKFIIISGLIFFAFHPALIYFSYELKPYSTDVLIAILLTIYFLEYNTKSLLKQFATSFLLSISVMFSLPAIFILLSGFGIDLFKNTKKFLCSIVAFSTFFVPYYLFHLKNIAAVNGTKMSFNLQEYFINGSNFLDIIIFYIQSALNMFIFPVITIVLIIVGLFLALKKNQKYGIMSAILFTEIIVASFMHIYPIVPRVLLFLLPFCIILICEVLNMFAKTNKTSVLLTILITILASNYLIQENNSHNKIGKSDPRNLFIVMNSEKENYSIAIPKNSNAEWLYYSRFFNPENNKIFYQEWTQSDKEWFNTLPDKKLFYYAPFEKTLPDSLKNIQNAKILKGKISGYILKID